MHVYTYIIICHPVERPRGKVPRCPTASLCQQWRLPFDPSQEPWLFLFDCVQVVRFVVSQCFVRLFGALDFAWLCLARLLYKLLERFHNICRSFAGTLNFNIEIPNILFYKNIGCKFNLQFRIYVSSFTFRF